MNHLNAYYIYLYIAVEIKGLLFYVPLLFLYLKSTIHFFKAHKVVCDQTTFFLWARTITPIAPITGKTANTAAGRLADGEYHDTEAAL